MTEIPPPPSTPTRSLIWAAGWAVVASLGFAVLIGSWDRVMSWSMDGQRTEAIVLTMPIIALIMVLVMVVRAALGVGAVRRYAAAYPEEVRERAELDRARRQHPGFFFVVAAIAGVAWAAGATAVGLFVPQLLENSVGLTMALMLLALLAMAWIPALVAGFRHVSLRRRA